MENETIIYTDEDGARLLAERWPVGAGITVHVKDGGLVAMALEDLPEIITALYEAGGGEPPVILGRVAVDPDLPAECGALRVRLSPDRGVRLAIGGNAETLSPALARQFARTVIAYADAAEAEPDPAEVEELAAVIRSELHPDSGRPGDGDRTAARAALRWMKQQEARR